MTDARLNFIHPELGKINKRIRQPASYIRRTFCVEKSVRSAVLYATALGVYELYLNGKKVAEEKLSPGYTDYNKRLQYQTYDVTGDIVGGENALGVLLGDGWYRGAVGPFNGRNLYGTKTAAAFTLVIEFSDGSEEVIYSDENCRATQNGPLRLNDLKYTEEYDANMEMPGWNAIGYDDSSWHKVEPCEYGGELTPNEGEKLLRHERFTPEILHTPDGSYVLDFKQNMAGMIKFTVTGKTGDKVVIRLGEALNEDGNFTLSNLQGTDKDEGFFTIGQRLYYTLKDGKQSYETIFLISGFRYAKLENWPEEVKPENFEGVAVYSDMNFAGSFICSNEKINKFVENVRWSMKSNYVDIPTDCPHRERAGWLGDANVFTECANYLANTDRFYTKWMADVIASQKPSGALPYIVPVIPSMCLNDSAAGWADAVYTIPCLLYEYYKDLEAVKRAYNATKSFVDFNVKRAKKCHILNAFKTGEHRKYILDTGYHFGEWLEPDGDNLKDSAKALFKPDSEVATAWFYYSAKALSYMAGLLGKEEDEKTYLELSQKIKQAYNKEFINEKLLSTKRQCKLVRPLYMGLVEGEKKKELAELLSKLVRVNDYKIGTGFLTTYKILEVLTECGYSEDAYRMMENEECPSWLYEVKSGATTVWEGWKVRNSETGKLETKSLNHFSPGAAASWLFKYVGGIKCVKPGFEEIEIKPCVGGSLTFAKTEYLSVKGMVSTEWHRDSDKFTLTVSLPEGVLTKVIMPSGEVHSLEGGQHTFCQTI